MTGFSNISSKICFKKLVCIIVDSIFIFINLPEGFIILVYKKVKLR